MSRLQIEKLHRRHAVDAFDCGREALNRFLTRYALPNQQAEASQTYVALADDQIVGYYTLVVGDVAYDDARAFYEHFDFVPSPTDPYHLFRLLKGIRASLKS